jgi:hypothetical protein
LNQAKRIRPGAEIEGLIAAAQTLRTQSVTKAQKEAEDKARADAQAKANADATAIAQGATQGRNTATVTKRTAEGRNSSPAAEERTQRATQGGNAPAVAEG